MSDADPSRGRRARAALAALACGAGFAWTACTPIRGPAPLRPEVALPEPPAPAEGRGAIVGVVADSALGFPIEGARVYFTSDTVLTLGPARPIGALPSDTTDAGGGFVLRDVPPGSYTVAARALRYESRLEVVVVHAGSVDTLTFRLQGGLQDALRRPPPGSRR